jgi:hypothetical protein
VAEVIAASVPLVIVMGAVTTITAFLFIKRDMKKGILKVNQSTFLDDDENVTDSDLLSTTWKKMIALLIPVLFALNIAAMVSFDLQGGDATALIGGTSIFILLIISLSAFKAKGLERTTGYLIDGFQFGFKVFGPVIPIAAFFYLGDAGFQTIIGDFLPKTSHGIVNDLGASLAAVVPLSKAVGAVTLTIVGAITGLDGSGFSGISLAGSVANLFAESIGTGAATLTALGQIAGIWVGGGTLVPWAIIPVAAICNVDPFELARRNMLPVIIGLTVTTIVAMFLI